METQTMKEFSIKYRKTDFEQIQILYSGDADKAFRKFYDDDLNVYESAYILLLNSSNKTKGFVKVGQGGRNSTSVDIRLICKFAIDTLSTAVILCHNHPSGNRTPSRQDEVLTKNLKKALEILDIKLIDSLIITATDFYSFADEGLI